MTRLSYVEPAQMSPEQKELYDSILASRSHALPSESSLVDAQKAI